VSTPAPTPTPITLNEGQQRALRVLNMGGSDAPNVFLSGAAGTGKSTVLRAWLEELEDRDDYFAVATFFTKGGQEKEVSYSCFPVLATTGAAALLVNGRTFHSFFGIGIDDNASQDRIVRWALAKDSVRNRLTRAKCIIIDEISMMSGDVFVAAEEIARKARVVRGEKERPWGGLRLVVMGDFAQLPPVVKSGARPGQPWVKRETPWVFKSSAWAQANFRPVWLSESMRSHHPSFLTALNTVREGRVSPLVSELMESRSLARCCTHAVQEEVAKNATWLAGRRKTVEDINLARLSELPGEASVFHTIVRGWNAGRPADPAARRPPETPEEEWSDAVQHAENALVRDLPVPSPIRLKPGALVMIRVNHPEGVYANGSLGRLVEIDEDEEILTIDLLTGRRIYLNKHVWERKDPEDDNLVIAEARNFPVCLGWAMTHHKAQGTTLDCAIVDIGSCWEDGQAYVALSRVRTPDALYVSSWHSSSIKASAEVKSFHDRIILQAETLEREGK
jgi:ATP-dependent DNA helicase PIF1